jgi:hypothetical protein
MLPMFSQVRREFPLRGDTVATKTEAEDVDCPSVEEDRRRSTTTNATLHYIRQGSVGLWRPSHAVRVENLDCRVSTWAGGRRVAKRRLKIEAANKTTAEAARCQAKDILARVRLGEDPAAVRASRLTAPTVAEFAQQFLEEVFSSSRFKPTTRRLYSSNLRRFVTPALGSLRLDAVAGPDVARLHIKIGKAAPTAANNNRTRALLVIPPQQLGDNLR